MLPEDEKPIKLGIKIEKPVNIAIHPFFQILAVASFALIGLTLWLLALEYLVEPLPAWISSAFDNLALSI